MKKIFAAILCLVFAVSSSFAFGIIPKIGVDIPGTMNYDKDPDDETKPGFMIGAEARNNISNYFGWGAGFEYVLPRGFVDVSGDNDFSFLPLYVSLMFYPFGGWEKAKPYIKVNAGFSVLATTQSDADMKGGLYLSAGVGAEYKNFVGEAMASSYDGEFDGAGFSYQKIGFVFGYRFNINLFKSGSEE
ncbi:MAG: hypothetical protein FWH43_07605 [Endomicrobia bacterium]|nr:hypothetical protein [Endomicrobiia bacterium]